jgi:hypothetical protein
VYQYLCIDERPIPVGPYFHFRKYEPRNKRKPKPFSEASLAGFDDNDDDDAEDNNEGSSLSPRNHWADKAAQGAEELSILAHNVSVNFRRAIYPMSDSDTDSDSYADADSNSDDKLPIVLPDGRLKYDHSYRPPSDILLPSSWMFKEKYVGSDIALELLDVYYSSNTFSVCNVEEAFRSLRHHRGREYRRAMDCKPINHISNLQIRIKAEHFPRYEPGHDSANELYEKFKSEREFLWNVVSSLKELWSLIQHAESQELHMELILMTDFPSSAANQGTCYYIIFNFLQAMRNFVYKSKYECENTTVRITHHDDNLWPFPKNYTEMFGLTKEQWEHVS